MDDTEHKIDGAKFVSVAQPKDQAGWERAVHVLRLDHPEGLAGALLMLLIFGWAMMRLTRSSNLPTLAKSVPLSPSLGHDVAVSMQRSAPVPDESLPGGRVHRAEAGRTLDATVAPRAGNCAWRKIKPAQDGLPALWVCDRCKATHQSAEASVPMACRQAA